MSTSTSPFVTKVLETLMTAISAGAYDEDGLPPQDVLARDLNVSRASLREAIVILRFCNVLSVRPKTGTRVNPKKDWNWNVKGAQAVERAEPNPAVAAIEFALDADEGLDFLHAWFYGDFDVCRKEWPDAPEACYVGADPSLK